MYNILSIADIYIGRIDRRHDTEELRISIIVFFYFFINAILVGHFYRDVLCSTHFNGIFYGQADFVFKIYSEQIDIPDIFGRIYIGSF